MMVDNGVIRDISTVQTMPPFLTSQDLSVFCFSHIFHVRRQGTSSGDAIILDDLRTGVGGSALHCAASYAASGNDFQKSLRGFATPYL
ncbi:MAG TPA: hypothetical protein VK901_08755, partial [Nitrospiraceae bacterium]|nr:hypothetical protein [Nitrospiraceae bacterium]